ncbi:MAG: hypothetical protein ACK4FA_02440 [Candidatus Paceibacteria bacterium]
MIDPTKVNINDLPKKFADGALGAFGKGVFFFAVTSGNMLDTFSTTPQIMKSIAMWMNDQVKKYEEAYGEIDMNPGEIISPIQPTDINK